jgi:hypothetical protein
LRWMDEWSDQCGDGRETYRLLLLLLLLCSSRHFNFLLHKKVGRDDEEMIQMMLVNIRMADRVPIERNRLRSLVFGGKQAAGALKPDGCVYLVHEFTVPCTHPHTHHSFCSPCMHACLHTTTRMRKRTFASTEWVTTDVRIGLLNRFVQS